MKAAILPSLPVFAFVLSALTLPSRADLLLRQDFNAASTLPALIDTTSSDTSRFYDISATPADADDLPAVQPGYTEEQRLDGVATASLAGGTLAFSLRGAWQTYYQNGQNPSTRQRNAVASNAQVVRLFPPGSRPDRLFFRFRAQSLSPNVESGSAFLDGPGLIRVLAGKPLVSLSTDGLDRLRFDRGGQPALIFNGPVEVTVLINKTGSALAYTGQDGTAASVGGNAYDAWIDQFLVVDEGEYLAQTQIDSAQVRLSGATGSTIIDLGGGQFGIPSDPGDPFQFELDDFVMRNDFSEAGPTASPNLTLSGNLNFGTRTIGSRTRKTMTIRNTGTAPMTVSDVRMPAPVFSGAFRGVIPAGASRPLAVTFRPSKAKNYRGIVQVISNATNSPQGLAISGTGRRRR